MADDKKLAKVDFQETSLDIWGSKYQLKDNEGNAVDKTIDDSYERIATALSKIEKPEEQEKHKKDFIWALQNGAIPAGRITSNAGAEKHKPSTSLINCTVSGTIPDSMDGIMKLQHEAALTLKAGCVSADTLVITEKGLVTAKEAVEGKHKKILSYNTFTREYEEKNIEEHLTVVVKKSDNIKIEDEKGGVLETSKIHPVLIYRDNDLQYVEAENIDIDKDFLVDYKLSPKSVTQKDIDTAWFCGVHLGDGSAYIKNHNINQPKNWRKTLSEKGQRLIFKIRSAEKEVVEGYSKFFSMFCQSRAQVVENVTENGTLVYDYAVSSYEASKASELIDNQIGKKTKTFKIPEWIEANPEKYFIPFFAGLVDADGYVNKEGKFISLTSINENFLKEIKKMLSLFGVNSSIIKSAARSHKYNDKKIVGSGHYSLKISDIDFLHELSLFLKTSKKIENAQKGSLERGQYKNYYLTQFAKEFLMAKESELTHKEKGALGFYHKKHQQDVVSKIYVKKWARRFPEIEKELIFGGSLKRISKKSFNNELDSLFYDFKVEGNNNYLAGKNGFSVIHNCGIGYEFSTLRPKGAFVAGPGATTSGPLTFMDIYDAMCFTVASAGGRRGAQMGTFDISHPDVMDFIKAKHKDGRLRQFNLSLLITDQFIEAVKNDDDWPLVFPVSKNDVDVDKLDYDDPSQVVWREWPIHDKYIVNEEGLVACKVYKMIKAQNLWNMIMTSTYDYAEPGFILIDRVNDENNNWFCEDIRATNPCVTMDTWVQTEKGPKQVSDLLGARSTVIVDGKKFHTTEEGFFETGNKDVYTLKTKEGFEINLTDDHPVLKVVSKTRFRRETEWCKAGELKEGDEVVLHDHSSFTDWDGNGTLEEGYLLGMLLGDGVIKEDKAIISVWKDKEVVNGAPQGVTPVMNFIENTLQKMPHRSDFKGWQDISGRSESRISTKSLKDLAERYGMIKGQKEVSESLEKTSSEFHKGFLSGLFDADGSVQGTLQKGVSVRLAQSNINTLKVVQRMLARLGIISKIYQNRRNEGVTYLPNGNGENSEYNIKAQHELVVSKSNIVAFAEKVGFVDSDKKAKLLNNISSYKKGAQKEKFISKVSSFEYKGKETVFDVQVPGVNAFDANGLYVHNCGEQPLPPNGACLLGSVNLTQFVVNPFEENAYFDFDRYKKVVSIFTRMLDNVVEINNLPLKKQREEIIRKRRHGMGFLGLGSTLTMLRMKYGSDASLDFTEEVSKVMALEGWRTGLELAKEKGPAPIMDEDFTVTGEMLRKRPEMVEDGYKEGDTVKGRVLHIKYSRYMQKVTKELTKKEVNEMLKVGLRFTHHTSIAPTGTISLSLANNASNGIEPSFSHHYLRNVIKEGQNSKAQVDVFSYELLAYRKFVDATAMPFDKEKPLPEYFTTSDDVTPEQHVQIQAAAQRWIDSSISKTANVPTEYPFEDFKDIYMTAYEEGLKGCTTFRFNPEVFSGVLVKESDLENTMYRFELKNGEVVEVKGNQKVEYEGQVHVAANLFDALKDGYYGKY